MERKVKSWLEKEGQGIAWKGKAWKGMAWK
jgi:hypothetical protein